MAPILPRLPHIHFSLQNVSSCDQCENGAKCLRSAHNNSIRCLCTVHFGGTFCDVKQSVAQNLKRMFWRQILHSNFAKLCASLNCDSSAGERCLPIRGIPGREDRARCGCPPGRSGKRQIQKIISLR